MIIHARRLPWKFLGIPKSSWKPSVASLRRTKETVYFNDTEVAFHESTRLQLVPHAVELPEDSDFVNQHLRWIAQKDLLQQDIFLIGPPGPLRRRIALRYAELTNREVEYLAITRDVTESDIKQRREILDNKTVYIDQAAVRAALNGRLLIVEGVEKAERNILPVLNNLLENREMQLDDGRFLVSPSRFDNLLKSHSLKELKHRKLERVSENFRVIALGLPVPAFRGNPLDPPVRSRFQARSIASLPFKDAINSISRNSSNLSSDQMSAMVTYCQVINSKDSSDLGLPAFPEMSLVSLASKMKMEISDASEASLKCLSWLYPSKLFSDDVSKRSENALKKCGLLDSTTQNDSKRNMEDVKVVKPVFKNVKAALSESGFVSNRMHEDFIHDMIQSYSSGAHLCVVGNRGTGKSVLCRDFASRIGLDHEVFMMYKDITARDLLQQRSTRANGDTFWTNSPLIEAAVSGNIAILDGLHNVDPDTLPAIQTLLQDGDIVLFDGTKFLKHSEFEALMERMDKDSSQLERMGVMKIPESFRIVAISEPPNWKSFNSDWLTSEVLTMFHFHVLNQLQLPEQIALFGLLYPNMDKQKVQKLCEFSDYLSRSSDDTVRSLSGSLSCKQIRRVLKVVSSNPSTNIRDCLERSFMPQFLPSLPKETLLNLLDKWYPKSTSNETVVGTSNLKSHFLPQQTSNLNNNSDEELRLTSSDLTLVPETLFFENEEQNLLLQQMLQSYELGEHLLLVGNQGVGKNKLTDKLLNQLHRPRQYVQLHRDTTVQTLTTQPNIKDGIIVNEDSVLVKAVKYGHVLVIDEADKAPTHVTSVLKSLIEDNSMFLSDGRKIVPYNTKVKNFDRSKIIVCHPEFRVIVLANRPGYPFLGNDFFASMGDLFTCLAINNPGKSSQMTMLQKYGPNVEHEITERLVDAFDELRFASENGVLSYPYSTRELVHVVKHLNRFPEEGVTRAMMNVLDFDMFDEQNLNEVHSILKRHGIPVKLGNLGIQMSKPLPLEKFEPLGNLEISSFDSSIAYCTESVLDFKNAFIQCPVPVKEKLDVHFPRAEVFQELSKIWSVPMEDNSVVCDMEVHRNSLYVVLSNPARLVHVDLALKGTSENDSCRIFDLDILLSGRGHKPVFQLSLIQTPKFLGSQKEVCIASYEPMKGTLLLWSLATQTVARFAVQDHYTPKSRGSSLSSSIFGSRAGSSLRMIKNTSCDLPKSLAFTDDQNQLLIFDFKKLKCVQIDLPSDFKTLEFASEDEVCFKNTNDKLSKFSLRIIDGDRNLDGGGAELFVDQYQKDVLEGSDFKFSHTFDSNLVSDLLSIGKITSPSRVFTTNAIKVGVSLGFPELDEGSLYGISRSNPIKSKLNSTFLSPSNAVISLVDSRFVPKDALPEGTDIRTLNKSLEWIDVHSKVIRYLPLPENRYRHPLVHPLSPMSHDNVILTSDRDSYVYTCDPWGTIRQWEVNNDLLASSYRKWTELVGKPEEPVKIRHSDKEATGPKHGKFDPTGMPHVGGNTWAGGSGGADTAGLGGIGGPYRLDLGHDIFQVPQEMKDNVPEHVLKAAKEMRDEAYKEKLKEIQMSEFDASLYDSFYQSVQSHINSIRVVIESLEAKEKEREWIKHQTVGEFDDTKLVDSILGEKNIYKKRGKRDTVPGAIQKKPKYLRLLVDISGSMYRFNGHDLRLQRELETVCMVMEALKGFQSKFNFDVYGHSGEDESVALIESGKVPENEKQRLQVLQLMHAHSQFCLSGDSTVAACQRAVSDLSAIDADERFLILFSDANLSRYGISAEHLRQAMTSSSANTVNCFVIFIGSLGDQATRLTSQLPAQTAFVCMDTNEIPNVLKRILTSTMLK